MKADDIRFIEGRLKFIGGDSSAPFPSMIVVFRERKREEPIIKSLKLSAKQRGF